MFRIPSFLNIIRHLNTNPVNIILKAFKKVGFDLCWGKYDIDVNGNSNSYLNCSFVALVNKIQKVDVTKSFEFENEKILSVVDACRVSP